MFLSLVFFTLLAFEIQNAQETQNRLYAVDAAEARASRGVEASRLALASQAEELESAEKEAAEDRRSILTPLEGRELPALRARAARAAADAPAATRKAERSRAKLEEERSRAERARGELGARRERVEAERAARREQQQQRQRQASLAIREQRSKEGERRRENEGGGGGGGGGGGSQTNSTAEQVKKAQRELMRVSTWAAREEERLLEVVGSKGGGVKEWIFSLSFYTC